MSQFIEKISDTYEEFSDITINFLRPFPTLRIKATGDILCPLIEAGDGYGTPKDILAE